MQCKMSFQCLISLLNALFHKNAMQCELKFWFSMFNFSTEHINVTLFQLKLLCEVPSINISVQNVEQVIN